ncbi:hypothetical protein D1007_53080 [Hordeum vulgare]|nr:hypothetical protein D1007_53080 [Hordeum vulgare]
MAGAESATTADLQLESLELDLKSLWKERDDDHREFQQFQATVNKNFITMQKNFDKIQDNFRKLLLDPDPGKGEEADHASVQVKIGEKLGTALVDSGSTATFVSPEMAANMFVAPVANSKVKVKTAEVVGTGAEVVIHGTTGGSRCIGLGSELRALISMDSSEGRRLLDNINGGGLHQYPREEGLHLYTTAEGRRL